MVTADAGAWIYFNATNPANGALMRALQGVSGSAFVAVPEPASVLGMLMLAGVMSLPRRTRR